MFYNQFLTAIRIANAGRRLANRGFFLRFSLLVVLLVTCTAGAQLVQVPFAGTAAGVAPGSSNAVCSTGLDVLGDGCPATQASFNGLYTVWTDQFGNIYITDFNNDRIRVIYRGGSVLASILAVTNPTLTGGPQVGYIYTIAGPRTSSGTSPYPCNGISGINGTATGDGCPAQYAYARPFGGYTDSNGNIFFYDHALSSRDEVRVIYGGGSAAAALIKIESGIATPQVGYVYRLGGTSSAATGYAGNGALAGTGAFDSAHNLTVDSNLNIYIADTLNNVVRVINGTTGILSAFAGGSGPGCILGTKASCTATFAGDNGPAVSASLNQPYDVELDKNGNLFIADTGNKRIRAVYAGGSLFGVSNPVVGNIYTVVGGGSSIVNGTTALNLSLGSPTGVSFDSAGNLYVTDQGNKVIWRVDGQTYVATSFAGGGAATTTGGSCSGSAGPKAVDNLGDGCPATQATMSAPSERLIFDFNGEAFIADVTANLVRSFTFNGPITDTAVGSTATLPVAFSSPGSFVTPTVTVKTQGVPSPDYAATPTTCAAGATQPASAVCSYTVTFAPTLPGRRTASLQAASTSFTTPFVSGLDATGLAPLLTVGPALSMPAVSNIANPTSVTADAVGNLYVSDAAQGAVYLGTPGGSFTTVATGLKSPNQIAVDGAGDVFIADTGNNQVIEVLVGGASTPILTGLASPAGVVSTGRGVLYVADTGNNRILKYEGNTTSALPVAGLKNPTALALDEANTLYIADGGNDRIVTYSLSNGLQGTVPLPFTAQPAGLAVDAAGDVYFSDTLSGTVYELANGATTATTIAAMLKVPGGIAVDASGNFYYTDTSAGSVTRLNQMSSKIVFPKTQIGDQSAAQSITVSNAGNQPLSFVSSNTFSAVGDTADFMVTQGSSACGAGPLAAGSSCNLSAVFQPAAVAPYGESLTFPSNAAAAGSVTLSGTGVFLVKTTLAISLTTTGGVSYGQPAAFSVTVNPATTTTVPTGTLTVTDSAGGPPQTITLSGTSATSTFSLTLAPGAHTLTVSYSGDNVYASSYGTYALTVTKQATATTLSYTTVTQSATPSITFKVMVAGTVNGTSGVPTLGVTVYNGTGTNATVVGSGTLDKTGTASITVTNVVFPTYSFYAVYSGDPNYAASTSASVTITGDFGVSVPIVAVSTAAGTAVSTFVTIKPLFGYSGTVSFSCVGMPVDAVCRFTPPTLALSGATSQQTSLQFFTNVAPTLVSAQKHTGSSLFAFFGLPTALLIAARRRRKLGLRVAGAVLVVGCGLTLITGCSSSNPLNATGSTPSGTSTVVMTAKDGNGVSHSTSFTLTVYAN